MCDEIGVFSDKEVSTLKPKALKTLRAAAAREFKTRPIKNLISKDPIGKVIHPHPEVRARLRRKLMPVFNKLKKEAQSK
jgi:hypothetical protein